MADTTTTGDIKLLDCRGLLCPVPIIRLSKAVRDVPMGGRLKMLATDPGSEPDMRAWERQTGHKLLEVTREGKEFHFLVERAK